MRETPPRIGLDDDRITQREAARLLGVSFPTCCRYMQTGRLGVRLPSLKLGGKRWTTREACDWFVTELQRRDGSGEPPTDAGEREWDDDKADLEAELAAKGL